MAEQAYAYVTLIPVAKGFQSAIAKEMGGVNNVGSKAGRDAGRGFSGGFGRALGGIATVVGGALAAAGIGSLIKNSVAQASTLEESLNAVSVAYGDVSSSIVKLGEDASSRLGVTQADFNAAAVRFSAFAERVVGEGGNVSGFVDDITTRAADFASVFNVDVSEALQVFQSGLAGEAEPLKRFGINLLDSEVKAFAMANGIGEVGRELTETEKVQARYGLLMESTAKTAGDFANTSDGLANSQRILKANFTDMQATIGAALLPALASLSKSLIPVADQLGPVLTGIFEDLAPVIEEVAALIPELLAGFAPLLPVLARVALVFLDLVVSLLPVFVSLIQMLMPVLNLLMPILDIVVGLFDLLLIPLNMLIGFLTPLLETLLPPITFAFELLAGALGFLDEVFSPIVDTLMPAFNHVVESVAGPIIDHFQTQLETLADDGFQYLIDQGILPAGTTMESLTETARKNSHLFANFWITAFNGLITAINFAVKAFVEWNNTSVKGLQSFGLFMDVPLIEFRPIALIPLLLPTAFSNAADTISYGGFGPALAKGGFVTGPTNALIGEAGPEVVIPLDRFESMMGIDEERSTVNYYAAPNNSLTSEDELFLAMRRAKLVVA